MLETESGSVYIDVTWYDTDKLEHHYLDGKEQYLFMTQEDFAYYGYVQESYVDAPDKSAASGSKRSTSSTMVSD